MTSQYPPALEAPDGENLTAVASAYALSHGLCVRPPLSIPGGDSALGSIATSPAPLTLLPSPFPRECFIQAKEVQKAYDELYAAVSRDEDFISRMVDE